MPLVLVFSDTGCWVKGFQVLSKQRQECSFCHIQWCSYHYTGYPAQQQPLMPPQQNYAPPPPGLYPTQPQPAVPQHSYPGSYPAQQMPTQSADPNAPPSYAAGKFSVRLLGTLTCINNNIMDRSWPTSWPTTLVLSTLFLKSCAVGMKFQLHKLFLLWHFIIMY